MKLSNILLQENYNKFYNLMGVANPGYEQSNREELIAILKYLRNYPEFMFHFDYSRGDAQLLNDFIATTDLSTGQKLITNLLEANELAISGDVDGVRNGGVSAGVDSIDDYELQFEDYVETDNVDNIAANTYINQETGWKKQFTMYELYQWWLKEYIYPTLSGEQIEALTNNNLGNGVVARDNEHLKQLISEAIETHGENVDLNYIDVSNVTDMSNMFSATKFNGDISNWDVSNVTEMNAMFSYAEFNGDISNWNVSNVTDMQDMFSATKFNGDISSWNVSNVTNMAYMFQASKFNSDISAWNVSNVTNMAHMFQLSKFNGDISNWDVSNVTDMQSMFRDSEFNGDISNWDVSNVNDMSDMFYGSKFNGDISEWDVSNVTEMNAMFFRSKFNVDISNWDVSSVIDMDYMFVGSPLEGNNLFNLFNGDSDVRDVRDSIDSVVSIEESDLIEKAKEHLLVACDEFAEYFDSSVDSDLVINHVNSAGRAFATTPKISDNFLNSLAFDDDIVDINAKDSIIYKDFYIIDLVNKVLVYVEILYTNIEDDGLEVSHTGVLYYWDSVEDAWALANDNNFQETFGYGSRSLVERLELDSENPYYNKSALDSITAMYTSDLSTGGRGDVSFDDISDMI